MAQQLIPIYPNENYFYLSTLPYQITAPSPPILGGPKIKGADLSQSRSDAILGRQGTATRGFCFDGARNGGLVVFFGFDFLTCPWVGCFHLARIQD
jgi:hypothetical protein